MLGTGHRQRPEPSRRGIGSEQGLGLDVVLRNMDEAKERGGLVRSRAPDARLHGAGLVCCGHQRGRRSLRPARHVLCGPRRASGHCEGPGFSI